MLIGNKAVTSKMEDSILNKNSATSLALLKVEIYEYCTLLCYFKQKFRTSVQTFMRSFENTY